MKTLVCVLNKKNFCFDRIPQECERKAPLSSTSQLSAGAKSIDQIKAELEALTFETPNEGSQQLSLFPSADLVTAAGSSNAEDVRRISSQTY